MIYFFVPTDGKMKILKRVTMLTLKEQQDLVGGDIEYVKIGDLVFCINEEGQTIDLPDNPYFQAIKGNFIIGQYALSKEGVDFVGL